MKSVTKLCCNNLFDSVAIDKYQIYSMYTILRLTLRHCL